MTRRGRRETSMYEKRLFVSRCEQIGRFAQSSNHIEILDLGGKLRQMLCDKDSLFDQICSGTVVQFRVQEKAKVNPNLPEPIFSHSTPLPHPGSTKTCLVNKEGLLRYVVITVNSEKKTVKDIIRHAANVAGGVHFNPKPADEHKALMSIQGWSMNGLPMTMGVLRDIAIVFLEGVRPIMQAIYEQVKVDDDKQNDNFNKLQSLISQKN